MGFFGVLLCEFVYDFVVCFDFGFVLFIVFRYGGVLWVNFWLFVMDCE